MVKLGLVTLDLCEVPVVKIAGVLQLIVLENDHAAALVAHCKILSSFVVGNCSENVVL